MSLHRLMVHDVTLIRAGALASRYGDSVRDWDTATRTTVKGWVAQRDRSENLDGREAQVTGWVLYLPAGTDIAGGDRVEWEGDSYEVSSPPNRAWSPRIRAVHHIEVDLARVAG